MQVQQKLKTIESFEETNEIGESLKDKYSTLYIFGFVKPQDT